MYILITAKVDTISHQWVASLVKYNFQLHERAGKANINMDTLLRVSGPRCVTNTMGVYQHIPATTVQAVQGATLGGLVSHTEAYSSDLHMLDPI